MTWRTDSHEKSIAQLLNIKELLERASFGDADHDVAFFELQSWLRYETAPIDIDVQLARLQEIYEKDKQSWSALDAESKAKFKSRLVGVLLGWLNQEEIELKQAEKYDLEEEKRGQEIQEEDDGARVAQTFETTIMDNEGRFGFTALVIPGRSLQSSEIVTLSTSDRVHFVAQRLGVELDEHGPSLPAEVFPLVTRVLAAEYGESQDLLQFANYIALARIIPVERSPLGAESLVTIASSSVRAGTITVGATVGYISAGFTPFLLITVPLGIVVCGAAISFTKWLEENRESIWPKLMGISIQKKERSDRTEKERSGVRRKKPENA